MHTPSSSFISFALQNCSPPSGHAITGTPCRMLSNDEFHPQWLTNAPVAAWARISICGTQPLTTSPSPSPTTPSGAWSAAGAAQRNGRPCPSSAAARAAASPAGSRFCDPNDTYATDPRGCRSSQARQTGCRVGGASVLHAAAGGRLRRGGEEGAHREDRQAGGTSPGVEKGLLEGVSGVPECGAGAAGRDRLGGGRRRRVEWSGEAAERPGGVKDGVEDAEGLGNGDGPGEEHVGDDAEEGRVGATSAGGGEVGEEAVEVRLEGVGGVVEGGNEVGGEGEGGVGVGGEAMVGRAEGDGGEAEGGEEVVGEEAAEVGEVAGGG
ncbi:spidroin-1-like [Phoenix dactylifera]|uniref:Spidroin-1-like n=1 Tax=Phoenix dactylifera TaxID=42345 RepID=A0A8B8ZQV3_PHODC|nr:spidroin-1-like [Phoenix dactylifera]